ncbi:MAG: patatin-like phospholipase family protein [Acetobacteraceae bacterium]
MTASGNNSAPNVVCERDALKQEAEALGVVQGEAAALCFSGGGIRSASFCLGVAQALAEKRLLCRFDYLSTVSGGGYIGGWLQQMLAGTTTRMEREARVAAVEERLAANKMPELDRLRDFTNYLTPRLGVASQDTWAGIALYLRNFLVNWLVFLPAFLLIALAPIFHRTLVWAGGATGWLCLIVAILAFIAMGVSVTKACRWVPSQRQDEVDQWEKDKDKQATARRQIAAAALLYAVLLPVVLEYLLGVGYWSWVNPPADLGTVERHLRMAVGYLGLPAGFFLTLALSFAIARSRTPPLPAGEGAESSKPRALFVINRASWYWAASVASAVFVLFLGVLLWQRDQLIYTVSVLVPPALDTATACLKPPASAGSIQQCTLAWVDVRADALTLGAPLVLIALLLGHSATYIGWRREARFGDLDREWLARLNGGTLFFSVGWTLFALACILPSRWITLAGGQMQGVNMTLSGLAAIGSGFLSSWIGKQVVSRVTDDVKTGKLQRVIAAAQVVLPLVFVVALFAFLSGIIQGVLGAIGDALPGFLLQGGDACDRYRYTPEPCAPWGRWTPVVLQVLLGVMLWAALAKLKTVVNVNRFSMHAVYRNRLVRAFLGTSREQAARRPDPFTGFDEGDNPRLARVGRTGPLFPVVNMTMNITEGERGAWAERKGASFIATPHWCGSGALTRKTPAGAESGAFVPTQQYGGMETEQDNESRDKGIHLGSVVTISGAAASPNWGYHSSPLIALLMTLFNVRLGAWYPNPSTCSVDDLQLSKPRDSLRAMVDELTGVARDDGAAVYLSDGGHFENLGVYEMLKRRCRRILVIDAGQDETCAFFDLGMMIRKAEIDLPVTIRIETISLASREEIEAAEQKGKPLNVSGFAYGTITYILPDGSTKAGTIIYLKPTLLSDVPTSVRAYAMESTPFPHESTIDQFFSESQFESYRTLGLFQGRRLLDKLPQGDLAALFRDGSVSR